MQGYTKNMGTLETWEQLLGYLAVITGTSTQQEDKRMNHVDMARLNTLEKRRFD